MTDCTWVWVVQVVTSGWVFLTCISTVFYPALWCWNGILNHTSALPPYFLFEPYTEEALDGVSKVGEEEKTSLFSRSFPVGFSSFVVPMIIIPATLFTPVTVLLPCGSSWIKSEVFLTLEGLASNSPVSEKPDLTGRHLLLRGLGVSSTASSSKVAV